MSKHTPGPWCVTYNNTIVPLAHKERPLGAASRRKTDRDNYAQNIASVNEDRHRRGSKEANARLIAAAPEMYEAMRAWVDHLDSADEGESDKTFDDEIAMMEAMRAALAKIDDEGDAADG